jgi:hypothetical protein
MSEQSIANNPISPLDYYDVSSAIQYVGGGYIDDFRQLLDVLEKIAPIVGGYEVESMPEGNQPEEARQAWVGQILPVRVMNVLDDGRPAIAVNGADALEMLKRSSKHSIDPAKKEMLDKAYWWWKNYFRQLLIEEAETAEGVSDEEREFILGNFRKENTTFLFFDIECGRYTQVFDTVFDRPYGNN